MKKTVLLGILFLAVAGCNAGKTQSASQPAPVSAAPSSGEVLATINGNPITDDNVRKVAGPQLAKAEVELYEARKDGIDQIIDDQLLEIEAARQGVSKADLLKKQVYDKIDIKDKDVEKFYNEKKSQMQGKKLDEVKTNIRGYLFKDKYQQLFSSLTSSLRKKSKIEIMIKAPRIVIEEGDSPAKGPKDAPVKFIEFTDYQCPFCARSRPTIAQILGDYKGKVRYILRDFPLSFHKDSIKAHEAAHCAGDQGKYWEMNQKIWDNQKDIQVDNLKKYAQQVKLNMTKFNECLDTDKYKEKVQKDQQYGETVGVTGTPAFFINGRMVSGARGFDSFRTIIDDELRSQQ